MNPQELGKKYDRIAMWWQEEYFDSQYGVEKLSAILKMARGHGNALDIGCGCGGRMIRALEQHGCKVTGVDVSGEMIRLARQNHPEAEFHLADICSWQTAKRFDFILAWDSTFHLPLLRQRPVLEKLCGLLNRGGILFYTFGNAVGEHTDTWREDTFYYSSIGINGNLAALMENNLTVMHLEQDQYPERHVCVAARKD